MAVQKLTASPERSSQLETAIPPIALFSCLSEPLFVLDDEWRVENANAAASELFGLPADQLRGRQPWVLWPEALRRDIELKHRQSLREQTAVDLNGLSERRLLLRVFQCEYGTVAHYHDNTGQWRLSELHNRLVAIVESADDAIVSKSLDGTILTWNEGAQRIFGYAADEIVGKNISMLAPPEHADEIPRILERVAQGEKIDHFETKRYTKDGRIITVSLTVSPIRDAAGNVIAASKVARDITDTRKVSELQERLAAIVESSDDAIISKDLDGFITSWNRGAEKLFGYTADEVVGTHISGLAPPDVVDEIPEILARLRRGESIDHYETKRRTKDGRILTVSLTISPIRDAAGNVIGASKVGRDVTDREAHEKALRAANAALSRSNEDLQQFAYSASHDLQEPLRMVSAYGQLLKTKFGGKLGPEGERYLGFTIEGAQRMEHLLRDLRAYTQASTAEQEPALSVDSTRAFEKAIRNLGTLIEETNAEITRTRLPGSACMHEFRLELIFQNLIGNAIRYRGSESPRIHVAAGASGPDWQFSVQDNGMGIDPDYHKLVFGLFKRLHSSSTYPGTGMGLAICERVISRAGGRIWVESELGKGSTFFFTLPR